MGRWRDVGRGVLLGLIYFGAARLGLRFDPVSAVASPIWPPTGIALAALYLFGLRLWPAVALAAFAANASVGVPILSAAGIGAGNCLEAVIGVALLRRAGDLHPALDRLSDVLALVLLGAILSTTISASVGLASLWAGQVPADAPLVFRVWWLGDVMGDVLVAPILLVWSAPRRERRTRARSLEAAALALIVTAVATFVFRAHTAGTFAHSYLIFPGLVWAALRFGQRGAVSAVFATAAIAIWGTAGGHGPFVGGSRTDNLLALQLFLGVVAVTLLLLGAVTEERRDAVHRRDEVLGIVSHDLNNPLSSIIMNLDYLLRSGPKEERTRTQLEIVHQAAERMRRLIGDLRETGKIEAGQLSLTPASHPVAPLVTEAVAVHQPMAQKKKLRIDVQLPADLPPVRCDRDRVLQVLHNLIENAIKFTPAGGAITVAAAPDGAAVRFSVADTGPGIPAAEQARVFERYWQGDPTVQQGVGLGLHIAREIILAHGGRIWLSCADGGSTFLFTLPVA